MPHDETRPEQAQEPQHGAFGLLLLATVGTFASYSLLLPVVPLWAGEGGAGSTGAGVTTGVFMLTTVIAQAAMPWLLDRFGPRSLLVSGSATMAVLSAVFAVSSQLWAVVVVSALRGVGFGLVTVTGSALIAMLLPSGARGRGSALYGLAVGIPNVAGLPAGVWLAEHIGHREVFIIAGTAAAAGTLGAALIRVRRTEDAEPARRRGRNLPEPALFPSATALMVTALAAGAVVTFLAVAVSGAAVVSAALFVFAVAGILGRSVAGVLSDRLHRPVALLPAVVASALGMALLAVAAGGGPGVLAVLGAGFFGTGFGAAQSDTLIILFHRSGPRGYGQASTVWNIAYDGGFGIGAVGVGALAAVSDYGLAYAVTAVVVAVALPTTFDRLRRK